jgi:hypothetical protein
LNGHNMLKSLSIKTTRNYQKPILMAISFWLSLNTI